MGSLTSHSLPKRYLITPLSPPLHFTRLTAPRCFEAQRAAAMATLSEFKGHHRLPAFAAPRLYELLLRPDVDACAFSGSVSAHVDILSPTRFLVLNALDIAVDSASVSFLSAAGHQDLRPTDVVMDGEDEILVLEFAEELPLGRGILGISFSGVLNDHMRGFYRSTYAVDGVKKNMAATQFEAVEARRCFPCWDEPALKAKFKITLEVPCELTALSNMPATKEIVHGQLKTVYFEESPIMSTYLVAVVVGLFDHIEDFTSDGVKVTVYCPIGKSDQGKFGLYLAVQSLDLFKKYFLVPYALPKLDLVVIPDFSAGAMENYGLITFRDTALLYDERYSAAANKQWIAYVVAHEVAHQWFGNLVTMEWWTHLWLNEGFATWVGYFAADTLFPEWKIWTDFLEETAEGLKLDALSESHPIEVEVLHARSVDEIFDAVSYNKGSSIIRMLQGYLGSDVFQKSLAVYIKRYSCQNAKTEDLWDALSEESGVPVTKLMNTWTKQKGYPVLYVRYNDCMLEFEQSQFSASGSCGDTLWIIPVTLCVGSYSNHKNFLLESRVGKLNISELVSQSEESIGQTQKSKDEKCDNKQFWVKVNVEQTGFYRVKYDDFLSARLRASIEANCLSAMDTYGILDDSFALCEACNLQLSSVLSLIDICIEGLDYIVLSRLISIILRVSEVISYAAPTLSNKLKHYFISLLQLPADKLGWENLPGESHHNSVLRGELLMALAMLGHEGTSKEALNRVCIFLEDKNTPLLPPDIRKATYTAVMRRVTAADRQGFDSLLKVYRESDVAQEKARILRAIMSCADPNIILEALNFLLSAEVRDQDVVYGLRGISLEGSETAWNWLKDNWELIFDRWGHHIILTRFVHGIVTLFFSHERANEMEEFFLCRNIPSIARTVKQCIEQVRVNANWALYVGKENGLEETIMKLSRKDT